MAAALADLLLASFWHDQRKPAIVYDELTRLGSVMVSRNPKSFAGHRVLGYLAVLDRRLEAAEQHFHTALALRPDDADTTAMLVQVLSDSGDPVAAEKLARKYLARHRTTGIVYEVLARHYGRLGRKAEAEQVLRDQAAANPNSEAALLRLAAHYQAAGKSQQMDAALAPLTDTLRFPNGRFHLAEFYEKSGFFDEAFSHYEAGAVRAGKNGLVYRKRQIGIRIAQEHFAAARSLLGQALSANPNDPDLHRMNALLLSEEGRIQEAIQGLRVLAKSEANNWQVRYQLGQLLIRRGDVTAGEAELKTALRLSPGAPDVLLALVSASLARLDYTEALWRANALVGMHPANEAAQLARVASLRGLGRFAEARQTVTELKKKIGTAQTLELESAYLLISEGRPAAAEAVLRKLYRPGLKNVRVVAGLAEALTARAKYEEALRLLRLDLEHLPDRPIVLYALAETQARHGDIRAAIATYQDLIARQPDLVVAYERLIAIHSAQSRLGDALAVARSGRARLPQEARLAAAEAQLLDMSGKHAEAENAYREWLRLDSASAIARNNLAFLLADRGPKLDEALSLATAAVRTAPERSGFKDTLGYVYLKRGQISEAMRLFENLVQKHPSDPAFRYHYALALSAAGDTIKSRRELQRLLSTNPSEPIRSSALAALGGG